MTKMFSVDDKEIKRYEKNLKAFAHKAYPFATRNTLNLAAFAAQKTAKRIVSNQMVQRNKFTLQSIRVEKARSLNVNQQRSIVGSIADYMEDQEFGGTKTKKSKEGIAIPTSYAAGQGDNSMPRKKLPRNPNKIQNIRLKHKKRRRAKNNKQALLFKVQDAVTTGNRYIYHEFTKGSRKGIFRVLGGNKKFKRGWPKGARLKMVYDLTRKSVIVPQNPWLVPSIIATEKKMPKMYKKSLQFQIEKHGLFK